MDDIIAAWSEVRIGVRSATQFAAMLVDPAIEDTVFGESDAAWSLYQDLRELAGMLVNEDIYEDQYLAITGDHIAQYQAGAWT